MQSRYTQLVSSNTLQLTCILHQVVFSHSGSGPAHSSTHSSTHSYKVFMKAEDAKTKKKSDMWAAPAAESSSKKES